MPPMPMDEPEMEEPSMEEPMMGDEENPYDSNFDAGVEANEETDPKKYIEQLTGKLTQSLNSYQSELPQPDADTAKYVAGMIISAAIKGLSGDDVNEILNKLKDDNEVEDIENEVDDAPQEEPMPETGEEEVEMSFDGQESVNNDIMQTPDITPSFSKQPYTAPKMQ